ncbi:hypothetical protein M0208_08420 [Sphingomonas sp. SUN019]|uniref:hypothetical protein n=1 Tax=Sphingomonas sp. SUN019 TaxID=2937788 RepID=UPI0021640F1A|nr:hypothetical protein [Sphingomonas sp. SUN019]UVO50540.1 hypothetical protein M0208_08420 [Sphingomonas sp. SUN019]
MRRTLAALLLAVTTTASARDPLEGRTPGPAKRCVPVTQNRSLTITADRVILYRESGRRIWRTEPIGACTRMRPMDTLVIEVFGGSICRGDRFRVVTPGLSIPSAPCRFGNFVPYDRTKVSGATK